MSRSAAQYARLALAAVCITLACAHGGELARPVPTDAQITRFTRFNIRYAIRDIIAGSVAKVEFYITDDMGATWRLYGEDPDRTSPMTVEVPGEGVYGFISVVTDRNGNKEREPGPRTRPETVIVVDRTPPQAKWLGPRQDILGRGQSIDLEWESSDNHFGEGPVRLQYAADAQSNHNRNANWVTIVDKQPANGTYTWTPPDSRTYNLRLIATDRAGNMAVAYCPATIRVDNTPPYIVKVEPLRSNKLENDIFIEARDNEGGSGVKEISLYTSDNGAATWTLVKETSIGNESVPIKRRSGEPIPFKASRPGEYPLWPVVFDEAGNATPLPAVAVAGPYILLIDNEPPVVTLSSSFLQGRQAVLANEQRLVEWTAYDPHIQANSASIALSLDNGQTWQELRTLLPTSGSELISFPFGSLSEDAKLRVTVRDEFGNVGESVSTAFKLSSAETTIDSVTPRGDATDDQSGGDPASGAGGWFGGFGGTPEIPAGPETTTPSLQGTFPGLDGLGGGFGSSSMGSFDSYGGTGSDAYGGGADMYAPRSSVMTGANESTASSLPQAMVSGFGGGGVPSAPQAQFNHYSEDDSWTPSTGMTAGTSTSQPVNPWNASGGTQFGQSGMSGVMPPPPGGGIGATDNWQSSSGGSPFGSDGFGSDLSGLMPQQEFDAMGGAAQIVPGAGDGSYSGSVRDDAFVASQSQSGLPGFGSNDYVASMPQIGGQTMPDGSLTNHLTGMPDSVVAPPFMPTQPASALRPPDSAGPGSPADQSGTLPGLGSLFGSDGLTPPPVATAPQTPPPAMPGIGTEGLGTETFQPPVLVPSSRAASPRAASNHFVKESQDFRKEGRSDLARSPAEKGVQEDPANPAALMELSQVYARIDPPDFVSAANLAKEATTVQGDWETWWNCADVFYLWSHASNREIQSMSRGGQSAPMSLIDERNSTLNNALIAINNAASVVGASGDRTATKKVAITQGMITYLRALTVPEPATGSDASVKTTYKNTVTPLLSEAMPYFRNALEMGGAPEYTETFQLGIINFRLAGLERDTGNASQAGQYYQEASRYLEEATTAGDAPSGGPREAYYMLALSHEQLAGLPSTNRARHLELALRYWRQTADFYEPDSPYGVYAQQRIDALTSEMGL